MTLSSPHGVVPESVRDLQSCTKQATMWYEMRNLHENHASYLQTRPNNNNKQGLQPPTSLSPLTHHYWLALDIIGQSIIHSIIICDAMQHIGCGVMYPDNLLLL